jgi:TnpA family transposase
MRRPRGRRVATASRTLRIHRTLWHSAALRQSQHTVAHIARITPHRMTHVTPQRPRTGTHAAIAR